MSELQGDSRAQLGERLREERRRLGLTQEQAATAGGVRKQAQLKYEKGETTPDAGYLAAAALIGFDVLYVLTGKAAPIEPEEGELLAAYRRGSPELRAAALRMLGVSAVATSAQVGPVISGGEQGQVVMGNQTNEGQMTFNVGGSKRGRKR